MRPPTSLMLHVLLIATPLIAGGQAPAPLTPLWSAGQAVTLARISSSGLCVATLSKDAMVVLDAAGKETWRWDFKAANRFAAFGNLAISSDCATAALAGDSSYRYTWIVQRSGKRSFVATRSPPEGVAISHKGDRVAVGTSANEIRLFTVDGREVWRKPAPMTFYVVRDLRFSLRDEAIVVTFWGGGVLGIDGSVRVHRDMDTGFDAAGDLGAFVAWAQPSHGPGVGDVTYIGGDGAERWTKFSSHSGAAISPSGDFVASWVNDKQRYDNETEFNAPEQPGAVRLIARDGTIGAVLAAEGEPLTFSADGRLVLVRAGAETRAVDLKGVVQWRIGAHESIQAARDFQAVVAIQAGRVMWFAPPR